MTKIKQFDLRKIIHEEVYKALSELNISTYANILNKTDDYPWKTFLGQKELGNKQGKVNRLAMERFETEFYKQFKPKELSIETSKGKFIFIGIKFKTNYTSYDLHFIPENRPNGTILSIEGKPEKMYIDKLAYGNITIDDRKSQELIKAMLKYNQA